MIFPREVQTAAAVSGHYDELDRPYREIWGEHVHHGYWRTGRETPAEAVEALIELVAERLGLRPGDAVCDIGCGYGASADYLASRRGVSVTGLTISAAQAEIGAARTPMAGAFTCLYRDWLDNGLDDASLDHAYAIESSEHMIDKARFFTEAWRVLRPGGRLVVCAWLARTILPDWQVRHLLEPICREGRLPGMGTREDYQALALQAGFAPMGFEDISRDVRRTWTICARRVAGKIATDPYYRRLVTSAGTRNRIFVVTVLRLVLALRLGAMRYGIFVWRKPEAAS
jgi:tocopherol O-methyltransferase